MLAKSYTTIVTLEVLYHAITVLSVRMSHSCFVRPPEVNDTIERDDEGNYKHLPSPSVNARRSHSADRILWVILSYEMCQMPFIPYALSLSLSVAYRKWRFSQIPMFRSRGRADFTAVFGALLPWYTRFSCASKNVNLAREVISKMEQMERKAKGLPAAPSDAKLYPANPDLTGIIPSGYTAAPAIRGPPPDRLESRSAPTPDTMQDNRTSLQRASTSQPRPGLAEYPWPLTQPLPHTLAMQRHDSATQTETPSLLQQVGNPFNAIGQISISANLLGEASELDVFSMVDPAFPQDNVDFAFFSNLDPTFPSHEWPDIDPWLADVPNGIVGTEQ